MLAAIHRLALLLNEYANLLIFFANLLLVLFTAIYVRLTPRTLEALRETGLRDREAQHLQDIKEIVVKPLISWIARLSAALKGETPELLTVSTFPGKPWQISWTIDDPFAARRLTLTREPDCPDILASWTSLQENRVAEFLYDHAKQEHFTEKFELVDRLLKDVRKYIATLVSFANQCAIALSSPEIPQARSFDHENSMAEWVDPCLLAVECVQSLLANRKDLILELQDLPDSYQLRTRDRAAAKSTDPDKLKRWQEHGIEYVRKGWEESKLAKKTAALLASADAAQRTIEPLLFTHSLGVDCELVSREKHRFWPWGKT
jgi:hypothetical protein